MSHAYHERNLLALHYAEGWYIDDRPDFKGWSRVLSLDGGKITFHIPDWFDVGNLPEIPCNWDGHTSRQKWEYILFRRGIGVV